MGEVQLHSRCWTLAMAYMQFCVLPILSGGGQVQDVDLSPLQPFGLHAGAWHVISADAVHASDIRPPLAVFRLNRAGPAGPACRRHACQAGTGQGGPPYVGQLLAGLLRLHPHRLQDSRGTSDSRGASGVPMVLETRRWFSRR